MVSLLIDGYYMKKSEANIQLKKYIKIIYAKDWQYMPSQLIIKNVLVLI